MGIGIDMQTAAEEAAAEGKPFIFNEGLPQVGDVNSTDKGSGARYNAGKPDMSLIPLGILTEAATYDFDVWSTLDSAVRLVGQFQMGCPIENIYKALSLLENHWGDCANVFTYGKEKYAAWNWAKGMAWSIPIACIGRHYLAIKSGQELDEESGLPHVGHIMCNIVMLAYFDENYPEGDDRIKHAG